MTNRETFVDRDNASVAATLASAWGYPGAFYSVSPRDDLRGPAAAEVEVNLGNSPRGGGGGGGGGGGRGPVPDDENVFKASEVFVKTSAHVTLTKHN